MNDASSLHPESGVRVRLLLAHHAEAGAEYAVELFFSDERIEGQAQVPTSGGLDLTLAEDAPPYAEAGARAFLRQAQSSYKTTGRWPRRMLRWRGAK